jgi:signal transduction histidine kinase
MERGVDRGSSSFSEFALGGSLRQLASALDWPATLFGPVAAWPACLRTAASLCLAAPHPSILFWGRSRALLYNDAFRPFLDAQHPRALGRAIDEVNAEALRALAPRLDEVFRTGGPLSAEFTLAGAPGATSFTLVPVTGDEGDVEGVLATGFSGPHQAVVDRRMRVLRDLAASLTPTRSVDSACDAAARALAAHPAQVPFALIYLLTSDGRQASLVAAAGIAEGTPSSPTLIDLTSSRSVWPVARALGERAGVLVAHAARGSALVAPVLAPGHERPVAALVMGVSPVHPVDDGYRGWVDLVCAQLGGAIASALAAETEQRRNEELTELDRVKTAFFSNVSHEFRTPLTLMLGPLEDALAGLDAGAPADEQRARLQVAHRNSLRLLSLVNSLLDFSRLEAGRLELAFEPTDLPRLAGDLVSLFRSAAERAGLALVAHVEPLPGPVWLDRDMIEKVVLNLLSNAFKHTFTGSITVGVRAVDGSAELTVTDTGVGIPAEELPRVFDRFYRVHGTAARTHEGTGIGLAIVSEAVRLHGGAVTAVSEAGRGSTFTVRLPLGHAHLPADRVRATPAGERESASALAPAALIPAEPAPARETPRAGVARRARVLLADDNADMREYMRHLLASRWDVQVVEDGRAALDAIRERAPDVIVSDVMMPRMDGFALLAAVRADPDTRTIPVILLSARAGEASSVEGLEAGADDYLIKPFTARELMARVNAHVEMARLRQQAVDALREAEERVRHTQKLEAIGQLAGGVAHAFNNLLTTINGFADLMSESAELAESLKPCLDEIHQAGERAAGLTRQLLAYSRKQLLNPRPMCLNEAVERVEGLIQRMLGDRIDLILDLEEGLPRVDADETQIEQILLQLAVNARDAMTAGGDFHVRTGRLDLAETLPLTSFTLEAGSYAVLAVGDTGTGIPENVREHLFEPFFTTKGMAVSSGLGLATVYGIVKQTGGHIDVESMPGEGTTFRIYLPLMVPPPKARPVAPPAALQANARRTILVAEDEVAVRKFLSAVLAPRGFQLLEASDGVDALAVSEAHEGSIELLVTDVIMPRMGGQKLFEKIRKARPGIRVLFMSGYTEDLVFEGRRSAETPGFIQKPFCPELLIEKIDRILSPGRTS